MAKSNKSMQAAKVNKNDEFYTRLEDIEEEISMHEDYVRQFEGKTVLCNCDDPEWSNFFLFFRLHFKQLKLKKVIFTHYEIDGSPSYKLEWSGDYLGYDTLNLIKTPLEGNGDFRSPECVALLDECDVVVTNPPFSLLREFIGLIIDHKKDMVIIANEVQCTSKEIFPLFQSGKLNFGYNHVKEFKIPDGTTKKLGTVAWFTTFKLDKYNEELPLCGQYEGHEDEYPKYDNYDAIEVNQIRRIPRDYDGIMGVYGPSFFNSFNKEQFEILGCTTSDNVSFRIIKEYKKLGYHFYKNDGVSESGSGALRDKMSPKIKGKGTSDFAIGPNGEVLHGVNSRIFIRRKKQ